MATSYLDADACSHQADLSLPEALPSFFANEDKLIFAPKDSAGWSSINAGTLLFGCRKGTCGPLLRLIQVWWDLPDNATHTRKLETTGSLCATGLYGLLSKVVSVQSTR